MNIKDLKNWNNFERHLSQEEINEIISKLSGYHFNKEMLNNDELQLLYCAEALLREVS